MSAQAQTCAPPRLENTVAMTPLVGAEGGDDGKVGVPITLNGVEKTFLFDTGGGAMNYILPSVALKLGMFKTDNFAALDLSGNASYLVAGARRVKFGAVSAQDVALFQEVPDLSYDGILSAGTMTGDDLDIDFGAMRLNFFSADHCPGDVVYWPRSALAVVPVNLAGGHFEIATTLDGHALTAVVDTGSPWTILDSEWAKKNLGFSPDAGAPSPGMPKDQPGKQIYFRKYSALSFPGITIAHPLVVVRPVKLGDDSDAMNRAPDMIIGMEVLRHLHLYYAAGEKQLYITPAVAGPSPLPKNVTPAADGHAWPQDARAYMRVWDPIHRPH
ncbi:MAG TPA: pepsin/retropepsin-like aspartic protease family protein [Rhizomicrobium sp.]|nr:pepsin/retropepsin-like aspartic protease family protein [Rhizomicrobium sp.]